MGREVDCPAMTAVAAEKPDDEAPTGLSKRRRIAIWSLIVLAGIGEVAASSRSFQSDIQSR